MWSTLSCKETLLRVSAALRGLCTESYFPVTTRRSLWSQDKIKSLFETPLQAHEAEVDEGERPLLQNPGDIVGQSPGLYRAVARMRSRQEERL